MANAPEPHFDAEGSLHLGHEVQQYTPNPPPPPHMLASVPTLDAADRLAMHAQTAWLRYYEPGGRGEWFILGVDQADWRTLAWVRSPWGVGRYDATVDEAGIVDVTAFDYYRQVFGCNPITLDLLWTPRPINLDFAFAGTDPFQ